MLALTVLAATAGGGTALGLASATSQTPPAARAARPQWRRVFFDDFRHERSLRSWGPYSGQPGGDPQGRWSPSHVVVARGILHLESYRDRRFGGRWVSGGVSSAPALKQTYGRYEIRMRLQPGRGVAFVALLWPVADTWPPEIDFAENGGQTPARTSLTATLHFGARNRQVQRTVRADFTRWHVLGVQWTPGKLVYTLDGRAWAVMSTAAVPSIPMEMDLQTQTGICGDVYAPCPNAGTPRRVDAEIDWVKAWAWRRP